MNVLTKPCFYDIGIKLSKLVKKPLMVGFLKTDVNLLFFLQILMSKNEKIFFSTSKVNLMLVCWGFI